MRRTGGSPRHGGRGRERMARARAAQGRRVAADDQPSPSNARCKHLASDARSAEPRISQQCAVQNASPAMREAQSRPSPSESGAKATRQRCAKRRATHLPASQVPKHLPSDARSAEPSIFPTLSHSRAATTGPWRACMAGSAPQRAGRLRKPLTTRPSPYGPMPGRGPRAARPQPTPRTSAFPTNRCPSQGKGSPRGRPAAGWFSPRIAKEKPALSVKTSARIPSPRRRRIAGATPSHPRTGLCPRARAAGARQTIHYASSTHASTGQTSAHCGFS